MHQLCAQACTASLSPHFTLPKHDLLHGHCHSRRYSCCSHATAHATSAKRGHTASAAKVCVVHRSCCRAFPHSSSCPSPGHLQALLCLFTAAAVRPSPMLLLLTVPVRPRQQRRGPCPPLSRPCPAPLQGQLLPHSGTQDSPCPWAAAAAAAACGARMSGQWTASTPARPPQEAWTACISWRQLGTLIVQVDVLAGWQRCRPLLIAILFTTPQLLYMTVILNSRWAAAAAG
jgi:hypothetical protein